MTEVPVTPSSWRPTPAQVHAVIASRPAFTSTSRPSEAEVEQIIDLAVDSLGAEFLVQPLPHLVGKARLVVALHAAALVESTFYPEQQYGDRAPSDVLYSRYQAELLGLRSLSGSTTAGGIASKSVALGMAGNASTPWTWTIPSPVPPV